MCVHSACVCLDDARVYVCVSVYKRVQHQQPLRSAVAHSCLLAHCMCTYLCVCVRVCVHNTHVCMHVYMCVCSQVCVQQLSSTLSTGRARELPACTPQLHVCSHTCVHAHLYVCVHTCMCAMHAYLCVCSHVFVQQLSSTRSTHELTASSCNTRLHVHSHTRALTTACHTRVHT